MEMKSDNQPPPDGRKGKEEKEYYYKDSDITEKRGYIPFWLLLVIIALVIWGVYYTIRYWTPPEG